MINVTYHSEFADGHLVVWAESDDLPGYTPAADSFEKVRQFVREYVVDELGHPAHDIVERSGTEGWELWLTTPDGIVIGHQIRITSLTSDRTPAVPTTSPRLASAH